MKTYKVHPVFDSDHALMIKAGSVKEAALVFLTNWPVRKNLVVSHGNFSEEVVNYEELAAEFSEVRQLLDSAPSQQPVPELAKAFAVAEKKREKADENWFAMKFVLKFLLAVFVLILTQEFNPDLPVAAKVVLGMILLMILAFVWFMFRKEKRRSSGQTS